MFLSDPPITMSEIPQSLRRNYLCQDTLTEHHLGPHIDGVTLWADLLVLLKRNKARWKKLTFRLLSKNAQKEMSLQLTAE